jgi:hypothetical protein
MKSRRYAAALFAVLCSIAGAVLLKDNIYAAYYDRHPDLTTVTKMECYQSSKRSVTSKRTTRETYIKYVKEDGTTIKQTGNFLQDTSDEWKIDTTSYTKTVKSPISCKEAVDGVLEHAGAKADFPANSCPTNFSSSSNARCVVQRADAVIPIDKVTIISGPTTTSEAISGNSYYTTTIEFKVQSETGGKPSDEGFIGPTVTVNSPYKVISVQDVKKEDKPGAAGSKTVQADGTVDYKYEIRTFLEGTSDKEMNLSIEICPKSYTDKAVSCSSSEVKEEAVADSAAQEGESYCQAGDFGWAMCPITKTLAGLADLFVGWITDSMVLKPTLFTNGMNADKGAYGAWVIFRDIANVIFVILLILVVLSQVTGIGISNYGIKKILPKLIVVAILVNLSFIICQLAVDISNILGSQIEAVLSSMEIPSANKPEFFTEVVSEILAGTTVMVATGIAAASTGGGAVLGILLVLVAAAISAFMLFLILAIRQAAVILLVAISPIAFVCYLLPNTETIFKKWKSIFWTMLVLYPVCGAVIGAGTLAMDIVLATNPNWFLKFIVKLFPILPAFIIPSLVKGTMNAFGSLGAKLNGMSEKLSGAAQNRVKSSRLGVAAQESDKRRGLNRAKIRAGIGNSRRARFNKFLNERTGRSGQRFAAMGISAQAKQEKEDMQDDMTMVLKATKNAGDLTEMKRLYDKARDSGNENRLRAIAEVMGSQKFRAKDFSKWVKADSTAGTLGGSSLETVAKQMTTGDGSKNYRAADALGYEYATRVVGSSAAAAGRYDVWSSSTANIGKAFDNHITNGSELYGQSADVIDEIRMKGDPVIHAKLAQLAVRAQADASQTGEYDQTKETALDAAIAASPNAMVIDQSYARSRANPNTVVTVEHLHNGKVRVKGTGNEQNEDSFWSAHDKI